VPAWQDPEWLAEVHAWVRGHARRLGLRVTGAIEQPHVRPWSTVLRIPTSGGDVWFKANGPTETHEAAVVSVLSARRPDCVPELLAADLERGWMLMADGGERLREIVERERDLDRWLDVLPLYAGLQLDVADRADELVTLGVPDLRLAALARRYEELLEGPDVGGVAELDRLHDLVPWVREKCEALARYRIPETIQHDDFHDGQVFLRNGRYLLLDWGDSCVSHPYLSMSVTLEGFLAWGLDDVEGSVDVTPYRDAYLSGFDGYASRTDLETAHAIALRLGWICRALNSYQLTTGPEADERQARIEQLDVLFRMFLAGIDPD
jgi:hypothetical protein